MENYNLRIKNAKQIIKNADYIVIGAGAGLSDAAGLKYGGESFEKNYKEFIDKYNFSDLYSASFYQFETEQEKWAFWAKVIKFNRLNSALNLYKKLLELVKNREYFIITTNVDGQFEIAGFNKDNIFAVQGDYAFLQCKKACHNKLYDNRNIAEEWLKNIKNCKIPEKLIPKCPVCGKNMEMNLRKDINFVQDEKWYEKSEKYDKFMQKAKGNNLLLLEIGVGFNTPGIIRFPFEKITNIEDKTKLIRINKDYPRNNHEYR